MFGAEETQISLALVSCNSVAYQNVLDFCLKPVLMCEVCKANVFLCSQTKSCHLKDMIIIIIFLLLASCLSHYGTGGCVAHKICFIKRQPYFVVWNSHEPKYCNTYTGAFTIIKLIQYI